MTEKDPFAEARAKIRANQEARKKAQQEKERERLEAQRKAAEARLHAAEQALGRPQTKAISKAALMEKLEAMGTGKNLNWKTSIVDLLKLLGLDSSLEARKALAQKLGCPVELMGDSAKMNAWLHEKVLEQLAAHGGEVPADWK